MVDLSYCLIDGSQCTHSAAGIAVAPTQGVALLRVMGECLFCGHCGADLPELLHHTVIRCDGTAVHVAQADFGDLHVCGRDVVSESLAELLEIAEPARA